MSKFSTYYIESLKKHICLISGLSVDIPSECKWLATMIFDKTQKQISETTIKRMYGFAFSRFDPSLFTLDTLAKYCDYRGWDDFLKAQSSISNYAEMPAVDWDILKTNAHKMTGFTMQALKGRSGIAYAMTIKRKFIDDHFQAFLNSRYNATVLVAPAGYGKTLALCHWIDERMTITDANEVILFLAAMLC
ncbi:hypothetical protein [Mucilaginibacter sp. SP1R1]|uniref:hypothetical protein n=1 Tax=Mucilaginibacter sp. SP1R1 TaxID=2723091 RepID=UPI003AFFE866